MTYDPSTDTGASGVGSHHVTAFFDSAEDADKARADLVAAGLSPDTINVAGGDHTEVPIDNGGFWHALKEFFLPDEDRFAYAEGLRRGGYAVSVRTSEAQYDRVIDILDADGAVDIDERSDAWRSEGWSGFSGAANAVGDNSTAGFGASVAGEDGYAPHASTTMSGSAEAESRGDASRVGTGGDEPGLLNPDMRERIGSGTASMMPSGATGAQDATLRDNAAFADGGVRADANAVEAEEAVLGSPTRSDSEAPYTPTTIGSTRAPSSFGTPDMRERIGSGTASMVGNAATGATSGYTPHGTGPAVASDQSAPSGWSSRRDESIQRKRVRGYILDPKNDELDL